MKQLYHAVAFLVVAIWGSTFVFTKMLLLSGLSPAQIFTLRFIIAYVLLLAYELIAKHATFRLFCTSVKDEFMMVLLGLTGGSMYFLTENAAMLYTTATNTSLIVCTCPLFAMLLIGLAFRQSEHFTKMQVAGSLMACGGMAAVVMNGHFVLHLSPIGDLLAFSACLCWAVYSLIMKPASMYYGTLLITRKVFFYGLNLQPRNHLEHPLPGCRRLHALLPALELGYAQTRSRCCHQLGLFQSRHHHLLCLVAPQRANHPLVPPRHHPHPFRHVPLQPYFSDEQRTTLSTVRPDYFFP